MKQRSFHLQVISLLRTSSIANKDMQLAILIKWAGKPWRHSPFSFESKKRQCIVIDAHTRGVAQISPEVLPPILSLDLFSIFLLVTISLGLLDQVVTAFACGEIRENSAIYFENLYLGDIHSTPQPTKANSAISKPFREKISVDPLCFRVLEPSKSTQLLLLLIFG